MPAQTVIKVRRDIASNWESVDPTLASGEIGFETDTNQLKVGNGTDEWTVLPYASGAGGASVEISETAPADPEEGDVWFNSTEGRAYIYYDSFWVDLNPGVAGPPGATGFVASDSEPEDTSVLWLDTDEEPDVPVPAGGSTGQLLAKTSSTDYSTAWVNPPSVNFVINGAFDVNQRNYSSGADDFDFTVDRWQWFAWDGTITNSLQSFTPGSGPQSDIEARKFLRTTSSGQTAEDAELRWVQSIEDVTLLAGKTVTVSFYAKVASGTPSVAVSLTQSFGTGGSPSEDVYDAAFKKIVLTGSTAWTRYSVTLNIPAITGKTLGTDPNTSCHFLSIWFSAGSDEAFRTDSLGIQNNTFDIWGIQLEEGLVATPFRRNANSLQGELAACQRYYFRAVGGGSAAFPIFGLALFQSTSAALAQVEFPVPLRREPTSIDFSNLEVARQGVSVHAVTSCTLNTGISSITVGSTSLGFAASGASQGQIGVFEGSTSTGFIGFSAELEL
jgi:hypothetical protein